MSNAIIVGALVMLLGLIQGHASKRGKGKLPEQVWRETGQLALIMFWLLIVLASVDLFLHWRAS